MSKAEGIFSQAQKFEIRMNSKTEQMVLIKNELKNFKNEKFKTRVSDFLQWVIFELDPPEFYKGVHPKALKSCLSNVKRYDSDFTILGEDINRQFKFISPSEVLPNP